MVWCLVSADVEGIVEDCWAHACFAAAAAVSAAGDVDAHYDAVSAPQDYIARAESREFWYRCPICRKSMEDMREYFSQMVSTFTERSFFLSVQL